MRRNVLMTEPLTISTEHNFFKPHIALFGAFSLRAFAESGFRLDGPVLDIGCGDGLYGSMLTRLMDTSTALTGVDYSAKALHRARRRENSCYTALLRGDAQKLPFDNESFQTAFANGVLAAVPMPQSAMNEAYRVLKSGGEFCCTVRTNRFRDSHLGTRLLKSLGYNSLADGYSSRLDRRTGAMHVHVTSRQWVNQLSASGFRVTNVVGVYPVSLMGVWGILSWLPFRAASEFLRLIPSKRIHRLAGRLARRTLAPVFRRTPANLRPEECSSILIRARKDAAG